MRTRTLDHTSPPQSAAVSAYTSDAYQRLDDPLCREFLKLGTDPENFPAVKLLFPYVRESCVLRFDRSWPAANDWLYYAFLAGHDLGCTYPDLRDSVLPDHEAASALKCLQGLLTFCGGERFSPKALRALISTALQTRADIINQANSSAILAELLLKSLRLGYATVTVAQYDPVLVEFLGDLGKPIGAQIPALAERTIVAAPWRTVAEGFTTHYWHPLLRIARELYPGQTLEHQTVLTFLRSHLEQPPVGAGGTDRALCGCAAIRSGAGLSPAIGGFDDRSGDQGPSHPEPGDDRRTQKGLRKRDPVLPQRPRP